MEFSIVRSAQISRVYLNQDRIAELNKKYQFKSVQSQVDEVTISSAGLRMFQENGDPKTAPAPSKETQDYKDY